MTTESPSPSGEYQELSALIEDRYAEKFSVVEKPSSSGDEPKLSNAARPEADPE